MSTALKILITTEQFLPIKSGVATVVSELAFKLAELGHQVTVATGKNAERNVNNYPSITICEFNIRGGFGNFYRGETNAYVNYILTSDADIIINECVQTWNSDLLFPHLSKIKAIKILHSHGFPLFQMKIKNPWANIKAKFYYRSLIHSLNQYDKVLILSSKASEIPYFNQYQFHNYEVLPNGVPTELIASESKKLPDFPILLSISNFFPFKNQEFILRAFYKVQNQTTLIFIGSSQLHGYLDYLKKLKNSFDQQFGKRNVVFYDSLTRTETLSFLSDATLFLHGSKLEAFPIVILEAMATATPFISTDVGNVQELKGGIVIHDEKEMSQTIDNLLNNPDQYIKYSNSGRNDVLRSYNWNAIGNHLNHIINSLREK